MLNLDVRQLMAAAERERAAGKVQGAEGLYREVLRQEPGHLDALRLLSGMLYDGFRSEEALGLLKRAEAIAPGAMWVHNNLGNCLREMGRPEEAATAMRRALELSPGSAETLNNLGLVLMDMRRLREAVECWRKALAIKPELADAHWNLSLTLLALGEMEEGWKHYEWRAPALTDRRFLRPKWDGAELGGKRILLHAEQGFGDTIQFVRYARLVAGRGGRVILGCQKVLKELLGKVEGVAEVAVFGEAMPVHDVHASLLSLPGIFGTRVENIPEGGPYLFAREDLVEEWRRRLENVKGLRVGIAWQVNPENTTAGVRAIPLMEFEKLARVEGVRLISLQKGAGAEQVAEARKWFEIVELGGDFDEQAGAFMDTAAVMRNLDLMVSADTATAHLAGALGVKVWTALPVANDWRWLLERADTPWYPTMRLWRQEQAGEWGSVFERMAKGLEGLRV